MDSQADVEMITLILESALHQISWNGSKAPDWDGFFAPYLNEAIMVPAARPAQVTSPEGFRAGMQAQHSGGAPAALEERPLATIVRVFGNVAIAQSSFGVTVDQGTEGFGVNSFLLVKSDDLWRIVAAAWDDAPDRSALPQDLRGSD